MGVRITNKPENIHPDLQTLILDLQDHPSRREYGWQECKVYREAATKVGREIREKDLIRRSDNKEWAMRLCMHNNISREYWDISE